MRSAWIEIYQRIPSGDGSHGRAPCGARGLKFEITYMGEKKSLSRPMRSVWAEIRPRRTI